MDNQRRSFLGTLGVGTLVAAVESPTSASATPTARAATPAVATDTWDVSWTARVNRTYRAVFDSTAFGGGAGLARAVNWKNEYQEVYGTSPDDMVAVLVVRADAIWLAMNDAFWTTYRVGEAQGFAGQAPGTFRTTNPIAASPPDALPAVADKTIPRFLASGNIVLACHRAFRDVVALVQKVDHLASHDEAETKAITFILPGVLLQPSGVFATLRAQDAGCHYILAS